MELVSAFSIVKYGAKIFLAVMGFISFDDINEKSVGNIVSNHTENDNVNYVESLTLKEQKQSESLFYADPSYFLNDYKSSNVLFAKQNRNLINENNCEFFKQFDNKLTVPDRIILIENENMEDFDILVLQDGEKTEFEYLIKIIEDVNKAHKVAISLKNIQLTSTFISY